MRNNTLYSYYRTNEWKHHKKAFETRLKSERSYESRSHLKVFIKKEERSNGGDKDLKKRNKDEGHRSI